MRLFKRAYRLQVDDIEIRGLEIAFSVERTLQRRPGRAEVKIWNLSRDRRRALEALERAIRVELYAGYDDETPLVFAGELHRAESTDEGATVVTTIRSRDGGRAHGARVSRSHAAGASWSGAVRSVLDAMGIGEGNLGSFVTATMSGGLSTFAGGVTLTGDAGEGLDRLMRSADLEWSVQGGALQILQRGGGLTRPAVRLAPGTGLVGSPTRGDRGRVIVNAKMIAGLVPGALVQLQSADHDSTLRIERAVYKGQLSGKDWGVELTCAEPRSSAQRAA